jgi:RHS repeat-associated protein
VGNENPGGASGIFNGQITTGCSYDPYTGNAMRSITDIAVAGAVGEYPLALVRSANSRALSTTEVFGWAGGWNHNYNWILEDSPTGNTQNFQPTRYTVDFPDGRVETFRAVTWDSNYRVRPGADTPQTTSAGVRERFIPLNISTMLAYLILSDGGKIEFTASQHVAHGRYYYKYHATAIVDPYGLRTQLVDEVVPDGARRRLVWVIDPTGQRNLHFFYVTTNGARIDHVTASDGRTVNYYYIYCNGCQLDHVLYYNNANWTAHYQYCNSNVGQGLPPLLWTAHDPMYPDPMRRIAYEYRTANNADGSAPVYGQIFKERYWDGVPGHENIRATLSELFVGAANPLNHNIRTEVRAGGTTRTFNYNSSGYLTSCTDFLNRSASQGYDAYKYISYVTDRNSHRTDFSNDPITGNVTQVQFPPTADVTPSAAPRSSVSYSYTNAYYLQTMTDEGNHTTTITRDGNNRVTQIDYADRGYETFSLYNSFNQPQTHRMVTGGTETFTYDTRGLKQTYRNPDNATGNPTERYRYDALDRLADATDVFGTSLGDGDHSTSFSYNGRGQVSVITLPKNPNDNVRHLISTWYNDDGTVSANQNELYQTTSYTYDDYRRLRSVTPPVRGFNDNNPHVTYYFYDPNGTGDDYNFTDSNVAWITLPSGKRINTQYDANRRKSSVVVAPGTPDEATTNYEYDNAGNLTSVSNPLDHSNLTVVPDERNRLNTITVGSQTTTFQYDTAGRTKTITRPNGQLITYNAFDDMNRVTQQTANNGGQNIITKYAYYTPADGTNAPVGLLKTMQDPRLASLNSTEFYTYEWDSMGRKKKLTYPRPQPSPSVAPSNEQWSYDTAGRLVTFTNRDSKVQTFSYDALNRTTGYTWNDGGTTPGVNFGYDAASRLISINNVNANISRAYFHDNLLRSETENILVSGGRSKAVTYTYDADGNRGSTQYPDGYTFNYTYTGRNQLSGVTNFISYAYDTRGNLITRSPANGTRTNYLYDNYDRVTRVQHVLSGTTRTVDYGYDSSSNDRLWGKRIMSPTSPESGKGEVFSYDLTDQVTAEQLNVALPDQVAQPMPQTITYDSNGNRIWFQPPAWNENYTTNNLSQYTARNANVAAYDVKGNLLLSPDPTATRLQCSFDAQNRVLSASKNGSITFKYDGLNRQVSRSVNGGPYTFSIWDGWNLIEEYQAANQGAITARYLYGAAELVADTNLNYYYKDGSGSTSHVANSSGQLIEWYRYDLQGAPIFYNPNDTQRSPNQSGFGVRHLFTGQQWYSQLALYDLRTRLYSPDIGRFLQPDPIGFRGGNNLYRSCGNNPVTRSDPFGLWEGPPMAADPTMEATVTVNWNELPRFVENPGAPLNLTPLFPGLGGPMPTDGGGPGGSSGSTGGTSGHGTSATNNSTTNPQKPPKQNPPQPSRDPLQPRTMAEFIAIGNMIEHGNTMDTTPAIDPIDLLSGGIAGLVRSSIRGVAAETAATGFRYVGKAEAQIIRKTGQIPMVDRFGAPKNVFYTNESFTSAAEAQRALSLPSTPAFRVEFNLGKAPAGYGSIADPFFVQPGGGAEFILRQSAAPIPATVIVPLGE